MQQSDIISALAKIIGEKPENINLATKFQTLENWDSLAIVEIMAFFDASFGIKVNARKILSCESIGDLIELTH